MHLLSIVVFAVIAAFLYVMTVAGVAIATAVGAFFSSAIISRYAYCPLAVLLGTVPAYLLANVTWHSAHGPPIAVPRLLAIFGAAFLGALIPLAFCVIEKVLSGFATINPLPAATPLRDIKAQPLETVTYRKRPPTTPESK